MSIYLIFVYLSLLFVSHKKTWGCKCWVWGPCSHNSCIHYVNGSFVTLRLFFVCWLKLKLKPDDKIAMRPRSLVWEGKKIAVTTLSLNKGIANKKAFELGSWCTCLHSCGKGCREVSAAQWDASINDWKLKPAVIYIWMLPVCGQVLNTMTPPPTLSQAPEATTQQTCPLPSFKDSAALWSDCAISGWWISCLFIYFSPNCQDTY